MAEKVLTEDQIKALDPYAMVKVAWVKHIRITRTNCFSDCPSDCDCCLEVAYWDVHNTPHMETVAGLSKPFVVDTKPTAKEPKRYTYFAPTVMAVMHLVENCEKEIEQAREMCIRKTKKPDIFGGTVTTHSTYKEIKPIKPQPPVSKMFTEEEVQLSLAQLHPLLRLSELRGSICEVKIGDGKRIPRDLFDEVVKVCRQNGGKFDRVKMVWVFDVVKEAEAES